MSPQKSDCRLRRICLQPKLTLRAQYRPDEGSLPQFRHDRLKIRFRLRIGRNPKTERWRPAQNEIRWHICWSVRSAGGFRRTEMQVKRSYACLILICTAGFAGRV